LYYFTVFCTVALCDSAFGFALGAAVGFGTALGFVSTTVC